MSYSLKNKSMNSRFKDLRKAIMGAWAKSHSAQGSNAIIMVYPPREEKKYMTELKNAYPDEHYIDISKLFVQLVDKYGLDNFKETYKDYASTPEIIFHSQAETQNDLFKMIIQEIEQAHKDDKIPIMIRTGMLYGTHIRNKTILEHKIVQTSQKPLLIMYPATINLDFEDKERIMFLGIKKASAYRGYII